MPTAKNIKEQQETLLHFLRGAYGYGAQGDECHTLYKEAEDWLTELLAHHEEEVRKVREVKLDQKIINAYENYMWNVDEAVRFVGIGAGSKFAENFGLLQTLIAQHKKDCYSKIEKDVFTPITNNQE